MGQFSAHSINKVVPSF